MSQAQKNSKQDMCSEEDVYSQVGRRRQGVEFLHAALFGTPQGQDRVLPRVCSSLGYSQNFEERGNVKEVTNERAV